MITNTGASMLSAPVLSRISQDKNRSEYGSVAAYSMSMPYAYVEWTLAMCKSVVINNDVTKIGDSNNG